MKKFLFLLIGMICAISLQAQTITIRGTVTSEEDEPIVGASLMVEGTNLGTVSDIDGNFVLSNVPVTAKYLRVNYVGMSPQTVAIKEHMNIVLKVNSELLDEVVVTALGISRSERSLGYSATQVSGAEIEKAQTTNVMNALQGKVAGLQVKSTSSDPGTFNDVTIRGYGSMSGSNQPLYVVDGVPMAANYVGTGAHNIALNGPSNIAPDDIASLTVLKGAAATALYGSRASNGVIIITTKSGAENKGKNFSLTYSGTVEGQSVLYLPDMQNKWGQGWNGEQTYIENGSWGPTFNGSMQPLGPVYNGQQLVGKYAAVKNNVRDFFDTGFTQNHNISLSGATKDQSLTYYASYSFTGINGVIPTDNDSYKRNTFALRSAYQPVKWLKVSTSMNFANYKTKSVPQGQGLSVMDGLYEMSRNISTSYLKNLDNPFATPQAYYTPYGITNPYWALDNTLSETQGKQTYGKFQVEIFPIKDLSVTYRFGFDYSDYDLKNGSPQVNVSDELVDQDFGYPPSEMNEVGDIFAQYSRNYEINNDVLVNYNKKFFEDRFEFSGTVGLSVNDRGLNYMYGETQDLTVDTGWWMLGNGATRYDLGEYLQKRRLVGLFGDFNFGWDDFIYLDISLRNDWSSTLPKGQNSYFYPGVTLSGVFTKWIHSEVLSFGKIRLAFGKTGSDTAPYRTTTTWGPAYSDAWYATTPVQFPLVWNSTAAYTSDTRAGATSLRPEMTEEFEVGANLRFFNGRIELDAAYYNRDTKDQIFALPVDPATGFNSQYINFGTVRNRGVELMLNVTPIQTGDWQWDIGFNWARNWNKITQLPDGIEGGMYNITYTGSGTATTYLRGVLGRPLGDYYATIPMVVEDKESPYYGCPIVDRNGYPVLSPDVEFTGYNAQHKWTGGITTALRWKGLTLSAALDIRYGGKMYSATKGLMQFTGNGIITSYNDRQPFVIPNSVIANSDGTYSENTTPIYLTNNSFQKWFDTYGMGEGGRYDFIDRTFAKLRNLSLTWSLPEKWLKKIYLQQVDLTFYGNNLFMWTAKNNRYIDPEVSTMGSSDLVNLYGEFRYTNPSTRQFGFNLKITY